MIGFLTVLLFVLGIILAFGALYVLAYFIRTVFRRRRFIKRLKRTVKEAGGSLRILHFPLRSLFSVYDGEDAMITLPSGEVFLLKFVSHFTKERNILLIDEKGMHVQRNLFLHGGARFPLGFAHARFSDASKMYRIRCKRYSSVFFGEGKRIMIFSPAPLSMRALVEERAVVLDNGVDIYHFTVYTDKGFLEKLDR
jgi:hypothetical protein